MNEKRRVVLNDDNNVKNALKSSESDVKRRKKLEEKMSENVKCPRQSLLEKLATLGNGIFLDSSTIENAGLGLFAQRKFKKDEPITEYYGEIVPHKEAKTRNPSHIRRLMAQRFVIDGRFMLDGVEITEPKKQLLGMGAGAFANDKRDQNGNKTNATFDYVDSWYNIAKFQSFMNGAPFEMCPKERTVFLRAKKNIEKGEEIFVSYGNDYWKRREKTN